MTPLERPGRNEGTYTLADSVGTACDFDLTVVSLSSISGIEITGKNKFFLNKGA